ncbi:DUF6194 family protein [Rhodococcus tibetensis]|uniref:DUF6194 family protein n=1 Tax=Rhodococcus tibetensis TaxID=2965064 RepID=A0ABT1Q8C0_9NOCA|nr:DUF6194 family protein [Rhodococcus sp. FXJ9.536]MCQ4118484.1 DUF6194 family protein [Rhodococcus sp. FXJ9.536]
MTAHDEEISALTQEDIVAVALELPGVTVVTASEEGGAPPSSWGDTFFSYNPDRDPPADQRFPFATIVTNDVEGWDTSSKLHRDGIFRLNISVGRDRFRELLGFVPAEHAEHSGGIDYSALDQLLPHPNYATQSWVSMLNPGVMTARHVRGLLTDAHARARARHTRPRRTKNADNGPLTQPRSWTPSPSEFRP